MEHVLYHARSVGFDSLGEVFLTQLGYIENRYQEGYNTVCCLFEDSRLCPLYLILHQDQRFDTYIVKYSQRKVKKEMDKLIFNL